MKLYNWNIYKSLVRGGERFIEKIDFKVVMYNNLQSV